MDKALLLPALVLLALLPSSPGAVPAGDVQVFILAGQSNMVGAGKVDIDAKAANGGAGTLRHMVGDPAAARFAHLVNADKSWVVRDDVWISSFERKGGLSVGYGSGADRIGPEFSFGHRVGEKIDEPVLLIKAAWGGKSLAVDFRPPSAGKIPYSLGEQGDKRLEEDPGFVGQSYREMMAELRRVMNERDTIFPELKGRKAVLRGFAWHQGWNDRINDRFNGEYESNMIHFITDVRKELGVPELPFAIAETGMTGPGETHPRALSLMEAQRKAAEHFGKAGRVAFVATRGFWRPKEQSPSGQGYHWNSNAETYYLIGEGLADALLGL